MKKDIGAVVSNENRLHYNSKVAPNHISEHV